MRVQFLLIFFIVSITTLLNGCGQQQLSFARDVKPLLDEHCLECHDGKGEGSRKSDFLVTSYSNVMKGTGIGPVVIPGSSLTSSLYLLVSHKADQKIQMPPHHDVSLAEGRGEPLNQAQIDIIKNWIDQGAKNN